MKGSTIALVLVGLAGGALALAGGASAGTSDGGARPTKVPPHAKAIPYKGATIWIWPNASQGAEAWDFIVSKNGATVAEGLLIGSESEAVSVIKLALDDPGTSEVEDDKGGGGVGTPAKPIAVGVPSDPTVAVFLEQIDSLFVANGVNPAHFSAREVTVMRKTPTRASAIPPKSYWPRMAKTLSEIVMPLRDVVGGPLTITSGYRPADYNKAVGGASGSRHQYFEAVDLRSSNIEALKMAAARFFVAHPSMSIGLGIYSGNIHVDLGWKRRTWEQARKYIDKVS